LILVDSGVWIDYFNGVVTETTELLDSLLSARNLAIGDLILAEVLQGFTNDQDFAVALRLFSSLQVVELGGREIAIQAAKNYRILRGMGITVRKTIDTLIATGCIEDGHELLYDDRDFDPFVEHLGLRAVL
jgi:hypothetical protein